MAALPTLRWPSILTGLVILLQWSPTSGDLQSDAGCHSALYINTYNLSNIYDSCTRTVLGVSQEAVSFVAQHGLASEQTGTGPCGGSAPHLFAYSCPHAALSDASQCTRTDTCPLVAAFPAGPLRNSAQEYYVQAAVASEAHFYVLTQDTSQTIIRIYRCTLDLTSCIVADVPQSIAAVHIAGSPFLRATLTPDDGPATLLHITYETWAPNSGSGVPYVMWLTTDIGLSTFSLVNVSQVSNGPTGSLYSQYKPYAIVVRSYLHIATQEFLPFSNSQTVVIYSCEWAAASCTRRLVPATLAFSGPALAHWPLNDYLYVAYNQGAGSYTIGSISRCALTEMGDVDDTDLCTGSQAAGAMESIVSSTPSIAFADHLGAVVVANINIQTMGAGLLFIQYDADFSGDAKLYRYETPLASQVGADSVSCPAIFDVDPATTLMRLSYVYTVDAVFALLVGEVDAFPSQFEAQSLLFFSPGYAPWYPPPLRQECGGTIVDVVASCPAVLTNGVCSQAWLFLRR